MILSESKLLAKVSVIILACSYDLTRLTQDVHPEVRPITWETTALSISPIIACHCTQPTHLKTGSAE